MMAYFNTSVIIKMAEIITEIILIVTYNLIFLIPLIIDINSV